MAKYSAYIANPKFLAFHAHYEFRCSGHAFVHQLSSKWPLVESHQTIIEITVTARPFYCARPDFKYNT